MGTCKGSAASREAETTQATHSFSNSSATAQTTQPSTGGHVSCPTAISQKHNHVWEEEKQALGLGPFDFRHSCGTKQPLAFLCNMQLCGADFVLLLFLCSVVLQVIKVLLTAVASPSFQGLPSREPQTLNPKP